MLHPYGVVLHAPSIRSDPTAPAISTHPTSAPRHVLDVLREPPLGEGRLEHAGASRAECLGVGERKRTSVPVASRRTATFFLALPSSRCAVCSLATQGCRHFARLTDEASRSRAGQGRKP